MAKMWQCPEHGFVEWITVHFRANLTYSLSTGNEEDYDKDHLASWDSELWMNDAKDVDGDREVERVTCDQCGAECAFEEIPGDG